jgi:hypothetical protein
MKRFNPELARKTIFLTGDTVNSRTREFLTQAGNPVVSKPFELEEFRSLIVHSLATTCGIR